MAQNIINYGNAANDGTGDPLRTAFIKTDDNFNQIWNTGPVGSNITVLNNTVAVNNTNGNLVLQANGVGSVLTGGHVLPKFSGVYDLGSADLRYRQAWIGTGGLSVDGNVAIAGNLSVSSVDFFGDTDFSGNAAFAQDVVIEGNLTVNGDTVVVNVGNLEIEDKNIVIAKGSPNAQVANGAGITIDGANAQLVYVSSQDSFSSNKSLLVQGNVTADSVNTDSIVSEFPISITTNSGETWDFAGRFLRGPGGDFWESGSDTAYLSSPANGFITMESLFQGNVVSQVLMEHSFIRFTVSNGNSHAWQMSADGSTAFPNYVFPYAAGNSGEILKIDSSGNLYWDIASDYGNANVASFLPTYTGNISANNVNTDSIVSEFPISITTNSGETWDFAGSILRGPGGGSWESAAGTEYISSGSNGFINLIAYSNGNLASELYMEHGFVRIRVDNGGPEQDWNFRVNGTLEVPGDIVPLSNAVQNLGNSTNQWNDLWVSGNITTSGYANVGSANVITTISAGGNIVGQNITSNANIAGVTVTASGNLAGNNAVITNDVSTTTISASGNISGGNIITTGNVLGNVDGYSIGYRDIPQIAFTGNTTLSSSAAGKHFYSTESTDYVLTIANNGAVSWPVGTAITIVNRGTGNITVAQATGVSLYLAGNSSAGNRTVTTYGMATILNVAANVWMINGTGVS